MKILRYTKKIGKMLKISKNMKNVKKCKIYL
jgi:hypothetical protein